MDLNSTAKELISQTKKIREASRLKHDLEVVLTQLTNCNNISLLSQKRSLFNSKVLRTSYKVANSIQNAPQTLIITVENVSDNFNLTSEHWKFCLKMNNGGTYATWNLGNSLGPGESDRFCCPLSDLSCNSPLEKISISLQCNIQFDSKTYSKTFQAQEGIIDVLHCLDMGRLTPENNSRGDDDDEIDFSRILENDSTPPVLFPPITQFHLKLGSPLKKVFIREVLLRDSLHRGFANDINQLSDASEVVVFYSQFKIEVNLSVEDDIVTVKCSNPKLLSSVKSAILMRLANLPGIVVEPLNDENRESIEGLRNKIAAFQSDSSSDNNGNCDEVKVDELMEYYLELRDISESIRFDLVHVVD